jgi:hypothetical protein
MRTLYFIGICKKLENYLNMSILRSMRKFYSRKFMALRAFTSNFYGSLWSFTTVNENVYGPLQLSKLLTAKKAVNYNHKC